MNQQHSIQTEQFEEQLRNAGKAYTAITYMDDKVYLADGRFDDLTKSNEMVNMANYIAAMEKPDTVDDASIYSNRYFQQYHDYEKIFDIVEGTAISPRQAAGKVAAASGPESLTNYEDIRKTSQVIGNIIGQNEILEELNAIHIAEKVTVKDLNAEYIKKTSVSPTVQQEIGDRQIPGTFRQAFSIGKKEIFADATSWATESRDKNSKVDLAKAAEAEIPQMFLRSKHDKVIALVNAQSGNSLGNWNAKTADDFDDDASVDVKAAEAAIKKYSGEYVMLAHSDTLNAYFKNMGNRHEGNSAGKDNSLLSGRLPYNKKVTYHETDDITSGSFVLARKGAFMKWLQGHVVSTFFKDVRTSGAAEQKFWFDFNGFDIAQILAFYRAVSALS